MSDYDEDEDDDDDEDYDDDDDDDDDVDEDDYDGLDQARNEEAAMLAEFKRMEEKAQEMKVHARLIATSSNDTVCVVCV